MSFCLLDAADINKDIACDLALVGDAALALDALIDEVRDRLDAEGILSRSQVDEQKKLLNELRGQSLPPAWGIHRVSCEV